MATSSVWSATRSWRCSKFSSASQSFWLYLYRRLGPCLVRDRHLLSGTAEYVLSTILNFFGDKIAAAQAMLAGWKQSVEDKAGAMKDAVVNGWSAAIDWIKSLPDQAVQWGVDFMMGLASGIRNGIGQVTGAVKGVAEKITSFLHFSVPDEGPLTQYESWMPDFMQGLAGGILQNKHLITDALAFLTGDMSVLAGADMPSPRTISRVVNQTNNFENYFHGDRDLQRTASQVMDKSAGDLNGELARALAFA